MLHGVDIGSVLWYDVINKTEQRFIDIRVAHARFDGMPRRFNSARFNKRRDEHIIVADDNDMNYHIASRLYGIDNIH